MPVNALTMMPNNKLSATDSPFQNTTNSEPIRSSEVPSLLDITCRRMREKMSADEYAIMLVDKNTPSVVLKSAFLPPPKSYLSQLETASPSNIAQRKSQVLVDHLRTMQVIDCLDKYSVEKNVDPSVEQRAIAAKDELGLEKIERENTLIDLNKKIKEKLIMLENSLEEMEMDLNDVARILNMRPVGSLMPDEINLQDNLRLQIIEPINRIEKSRADLKILKRSSLVT